jgi:FMN-dependent oxidoreductase (nitrilotriacetate monooxygenase family)
MTKKAEAGLFDSIFLADVLGLWNDVQTTPFNWLEPITTLAALSMVTKRIGLIATASTTYTEPFNLARYFASLDHISHGRIGWNIVTTWSSQAGGNFGGIGEVSHADRYERAEEYMSVVKGLWDSWADDAVLDDRASGRYANPNGVRAINHSGAHYKVKGPLNLPRSPQGRPVFVQAGSSDTGKRFAARHSKRTAHNCELSMVRSSGQGDQQRGPSAVDAKCPNGRSRAVYASVVAACSILPLENVVGSCIFRK